MSDAKNNMHNILIAFLHFEINQNTTNMVFAINDTVL